MASFPNEQNVIGAPTQIPSLEMDFHNCGIGQDGWCGPHQKMPEREGSDMLFKVLAATACRDRAGDAQVNLR